MFLVVPRGRSARLDVRWAQGVGRKRELLRKKRRGARGRGTRGKGATDKRQGLRRTCPHQSVARPDYFLFRASNSSIVRGQSERSRRERLRSARSLPPVWH